MAGEPVEGQLLLLAAAKASVGPARLSELVDLVQAELGDELDSYRSRFERVHADDEREVFLAETDHWQTVGDRLEFSERETDAVRRAHREQLLRIGRRTDREPEFEAALEIRTAVAIGI